MVRWVLAVALLGVWACSSSTTNEGSGGSSSGGAGGTGGAAGAGGGVVDGGGQCNWTECLVQGQASAACKAEYDACALVYKNDAFQYATCSCSGDSTCLLPANANARTLLWCLAKDPTLAPMCLGLPQCLGEGDTCGGNVACCSGLYCKTGTCQP